MLNSVAAVAFVFDLVNDLPLVSFDDDATGTSESSSAFIVGSVREGAGFFAGFTTSLSLSCAISTSSADFFDFAALVFFGLAGPRTAPVHVFLMRLHSAQDFDLPVFAKTHRTFLLRQLSQGVLKKVLVPSSDLCGCTYPTLYSSASSSSEDEYAMSAALFTFEYVQCFLIRSQRRQRMPNSFPAGVKHARFLE